MAAQNTILVILTLLNINKGYQNNCEKHVSTDLNSKSTKTRGSGKLNKYLVLISNISINTTRLNHNTVLNYLLQQNTTQEEKYDAD